MTIEPSSGALLVGISGVRIGGEVITTGDLGKFAARWAGSTFILGELPPEHPMVETNPNLLRAMMSEYMPFAISAAGGKEPGGVVLRATVARFVEPEVGGSGVDRSFGLRLYPEQGQVVAVDSRPDSIIALNFMGASQFGVEAVTGNSTLAAEILFARPVGELPPLISPRTMLALHSPGQ